ncbi:glycosyltransferase [Pediococcus acidilactici]
MKVLVVVPFLSGKGGMETILVKVWKFLKQQDSLEVEFYFPQGVEDSTFLQDFPKNNVKTFTGNRLVRQAFGTYSLFNKIKKTDADLIICMSTRLVSMVQKVRSILNKKFKIISWIHFSLYHEKAIKIQDLKKADYHLSISSGITKQMKDQGILSDRIFTVLNPIEKHTDSMINIKDTRKFIYMARLQYEGQKNFSALIEAAKKIKKNFLIEVYGDGPEKSQIVSEIRKYGLESKFIFHGWVPDAWSQVTEGKALVLCSKYEGFPTVLGESIARGLPVISTNCPTGPDDIVRNDNGILVDKTEDLSKAMIDILDGNVTFSTETVKNSITDLYEEEYFKRFLNSLKRIHGN